MIDRRCLLLGLALFPLCSAGTANPLIASVEDVFAMLGVSQLFMPLCSQCSYQLDADNLKLLLDTYREKNNSYVLYRGFVIEDSVARCLKVMERLS